MGYGSYSYESHQNITNARSNQSRSEVFQQSKVHPLMNPLGVGIRESRDSQEHPNSVPIIFALDVTGSMGEIPEQLARKELPQFMKTLLDSGVTDPQVLFMFVGDAAHDRGPLQVGQFESTAEDMDRWLTWSWLEGGGGGNGCESYDLAMYFAARHTEHDAAVRRNRRGYFFMTGDENPYPTVSKTWVSDLIGDDLNQDVKLEQIVEELSRCYHPFFLVPDKGRLARCGAAWERAFGDHVIPLERSEDTCLVSAALVALCEGMSVQKLTERLKASGSDRKRIGRVVTAVERFAATLTVPVLEPVMP